MPLFDNPLLQVSDEELDKILESCDMDLKRLEDGTRAIVEWCNHEPHLKDAAPYLEKTVIIERQLLLSKGSLEECKKKIDRLLTIRGLVPEICLNRSADNFKTILSCMEYATLPKLSPTDQSRIIVTQFNKNIDEFVAIEFFRYIHCIGEYKMYTDYAIAERYVIDMKNLNFGLLGKINLVLMKKSEMIASEGYGSRVKGIHILNAPPFVDKILFLLKQTMKPKVANRILIHSSYEELHQHVPKEVLPQDYGGDIESVRKLLDAWTDLMSTDEAKQRVKDFDKMVSDETRRSNSKFNEEYMGMPGSFRKLDVD